MQFIGIFEIVISLPTAFCNTHRKKKNKNIKVTLNDTVSAPIKQ